MSVAVQIITDLVHLDDVDVTIGAGVDEYALVYDHDTGKFVAGGRQKVVHGWTGVKAVNDYQLLIENINEDASGPDDYQNEVHLRLQAGTTANHRRYIDFSDYQGNNQWYVGINASNALICYSDQDSAHRMFMFDSVTATGAEGQTWLNSAGSGRIRFNYHSGDTTGTGGYYFYSGGAYATNTLILALGNAAPGDGDSATILYLNSGRTATKAGYIYFTDQTLTASQWILGKTSANGFVLTDAVNSRTAAFWDQSSHFGVFNPAPTTTLDVLLTDSGTSALAVVATIGHNTSGTAATGYGAALSFKLQSDTTTGQIAAYIGAEWTVATHATRTSKLTFHTASAGTAPAARMTILGTGYTGLGLTQPQTRLHLTEDDAATATISNVLTISHNTSGTPAAGFGAGQLFTLESTTTAYQNAGRIQAIWYEATHATRKADLVLTAYDTAEREGVRIRANGSASAIGFLGAPPITRIAHVADPTGGAVVDAEARSAINSILATLEGFGFHAAS